MPTDVFSCVIQATPRDGQSTGIYYNLDVLDPGHFRAMIRGLDHPLVGIPRVVIVKSMLADHTSPTLDIFQGTERILRTHAALEHGCAFGNRAVLRWEIVGEQNLGLEPTNKW